MYVTKILFIKFSSYYSRFCCCCWKRLYSFESKVAGAKLTNFLSRKQQAMCMSTLVPLLRKQTVDLYSRSRMTTTIFVSMDNALYLMWYRDTVEVFCCLIGTEFNTGCLNPRSSNIAMLQPKFLFVPCTQLAIVCSVKS